MNETRQREILAAAAASEGPATLVFVDLDNFKAMNILLGHVWGDKHVLRVQERLGELGRTWRVEGDEFVALAPMPLARATDRARTLSWIMQVTVGATEAWSFKFRDGRPAPTVPYRSLVVACTPRCGLAEVGTDPAAALALAERRSVEIAYALRPPGVSELAPGFAPLGPRMGAAATTLAEPKCPACDAGKPTILNQDLGWSEEQCPQCGAHYDRNDLLFVLGEEQGGGYM